MVASRHCDWVATKLLYMVVTRLVYRTDICFRHIRCRIINYKFFYLSAKPSSNFRGFLPLKNEFLNNSVSSPPDTISDISAVCISDGQRCSKTLQTVRSKIFGNLPNSRALSTVKLCFHWSSLQTRIFDQCAIRKVLAQPRSTGTSLMTSSHFSVPKRRLAACHIP